jgi:hypothetical protein
VIAVMLRPAAAYASLAREPGRPTALGLLRRPAFFALLLGACISLSTTGRLTLRLLLSGAVLWSFAPALQMIAAAAVILLLRRGPLSLAAGLELYFLGLGPWSLWLLGVAGLVSWLSPERTATWTADPGISILTTAVVPLVWSAVITFGFLRGALALGRRRALLGLALHGALVWGPVIAFFLSSGQLAPRIAGALNR